MTPAVVAGETLLLHPGRAAFWPTRGTVFVADLHWGKAAAFLAAGVPVPQDSTAADLARLSAVLDETAAARLVILGDLFHAKAGRSPQLLGAVREWRDRHSRVEIRLVRGNHDRHAGDPPAGWDFACVAEPDLDAPFAYRHYPDPTAGAYTLAGHVHPAVILRGPGRQKLTLPCFFFGPDVGILPAFGGFTGNGTVTPRPGDGVFVVADGEIVPVGA